MSTPTQPTTSEPVQLKCADCGYDLRGLTTDSRCPECGLSIAESLTTHRSFTRHQLAVLACRVLALWMLIQIGLHLANTLESMLWLINLGPPTSGTLILLGMLAASLPLLADVAIAVLLWFFSPWIAKRIFSENGPVWIGGPAGGADMLPLAPLIVGVVFVALGVKAAVQVVAAAVANVSGDVVGIALVSMVSYTIVGFSLLIGTPRIVQGIKWLRTAGQVTGAP